MEALPYLSKSDTMATQNVRKIFSYQFSVQESRKEQSITATKAHSTAHILEWIDHECVGEYFRGARKNKHLEENDGE